MKVPFISMSSIPSFSSVKAGIGSASSKLSHLFSAHVWRNLPSARSVASIVASHPILFGSLGVLIIGGMFVYRHRKGLLTRLALAIGGSSVSKQPDTAATKAPTRAEKEAEETTKRMEKAKEHAREIVRKRLEAAKGLATSAPPPGTPS